MPFSTLDLMSGIEMRVVRGVALRSGDPGFKTHSDHLFNLFLVVPGSSSAAPVNSQLSASGQLNVLFCHDEKPLWGVPIMFCFVFNCQQDV